MTSPDLFVATCDLGAQVRGRGAPGSRLDSVLRSSVGWVPANLALTAFGDIAPDNAFGSAGDLRLIPDEATSVVVPTDPETDVPALRLFLADQTLTDGAPWTGCPRGFLRQVLADFEQTLGLRVVASFEHEFVLLGLDGSPPFSLRRHRDAARFGGELLDLLANCGFEPETWLPEYGESQFEITLAPTGALVAADRAVLLRELVRDLAARRGLRASFAPLQRPDGTGTGVHLHLSFRSADGQPTLFDPARPGRLSESGTRFAAGVLRHARALSAWTAPSPASFLRLTPRRWSSVGAFLAERNREALLRICPTTSADEDEAARQLNLEYRACDATANPWLALGLLLRAGLAGMTDPSCPSPTVWPEDVTTTGPAEVAPLPTSLPEALGALVADEELCSWLPAPLLDTFLAVKRHEIAQVDGLEAADVVQRIADVY